MLVVREAALAAGRLAVAAKVVTKERGVVAASLGKVGPAAALSEGAVVVEAVEEVKLAAAAATEAVGAVVAAVAKDWLALTVGGIRCAAHTCNCSRPRQLSPAC